MSDIKPEAAAGNGRAEAAASPQDALVARIEADWKAVAFGGRLDALRADLKELWQRDTSDHAPINKYSTDMTAINKDLDKQYLLPNLEIDGVSDDKVIVRDLARNGKEAALQQGNGMVQVVDVDKMNYPFGPIQLKDQTYDPHALDGQVSPADVHQGASVPDCRFESRLAALAQADPDAVKKMIKDNRDGTYTVTFPGDPSHPETIAAPTDWEKDTFSDGRGGNEWALILDKAYRQRIHQPFGPYGPAEGIEGLLTGNKSALLVPLTGLECGSVTNAIDWLGSKLGMTPTCPANFPQEEVATQVREATKPAIGEDPEQTARILQDALQHHMMITTFFDADALAKAGASATAIDSHGNHIKLLTEHAYTVTGYDPAKQTVTIRNPWGTNFNSATGALVGDGYFVMPLEQFRQLSGALDVELTSRSQ